MRALGQRCVYRLGARWGASGLRHIAPDVLRGGFRAEPDGACTGVAPRSTGATSVAGSR